MSEVYHPERVYSPTRVMHGQRNAVAFCQSSIQSMCKDLLGRFRQWLDDLLFFAKDEPAPLDALEAFFKVCHSFGLKLHAAKCILFLTEVRWCGRIISRDGVRIHVNCG